MAAFLSAIGTCKLMAKQTSSCSIHVYLAAGIYYPSGSLRAKLCVSGKKQLYSYCSEKGVPHNRIGKLIVAKDKDQVTKLRNYLENGKRNGVNDLKVRLSSSISINTS